MKPTTFSSTSVLALLTSTMTFAAPASVPGVYATERTDTTGFVGITIPLAANPQIHVNFGVRQVIVGSGGDVAGGELRLSFDPWSLGGFQLRGLAIGGTVDHSGMIGAGWDFASGMPFATLGVGLPHVSAVADIGLAGLVPQFALGLDSLGQVEAPDPVVVLSPPPPPTLSPPPPPICPVSVGPGTNVLVC